MLSSGVLPWSNCELRMCCIILSPLLSLSLSLSLFLSLSLSFTPPLSPLSPSPSLSSSLSPFPAVYSSSPFLTHLSTFPLSLIYSFSLSDPPALPYSVPALNIYIHTYYSHVTVLLLASIQHMMLLPAIYHFLLLYSLSRWLLTTIQLWLTSTITIWH